jgi:hypothetical protein
VAAPGHIYHWKHGWIPITPRAAMIKAKGSHSLGERYMHRYGVHDSRVGEAERRTERVGEGPGGRGSFRYVKGTKTRDYPDRAPVGRPTGDMHPDEAFRMGRKELEGHAAGGSKVAQAELDRRAAKRGGKPVERHPDAPKPTAKPSTPPAGHPDAPAPAPHTPTKPLAEHDDRELAREVYRRGGTVGADGRYYPGTASRDVRPGDRNPTLENYGDDELARELHRRGGAVDTNGNHVPGGSAGAHTPAGESMAERLAREDVEISAQLPAGHVVSGREWGSGGEVYSRHSTADSHRSVGVVQGSDAKGFTAYRYTYKSPTQMAGTRHELGTFSSRADAHRAIAEAHVAAKAAEAAKAAKAAESAKRKAAKLAGIAGPHGTTWEAHTVTGDGTYTGDRAAGKAKQAFKAGGHTVVIESAMSEAETKGLLGDITSALERSHPNLKGTGVKFLVPTGDSTFRQSRRGVVGAYVHRGGTTVHINPSVANNKLADAFARGGQTGHFMPAAKDVAPREYTILHELGHVTHNVHGHVDAGPFSPPDAALRHVTHAHSKYGRSSPFEGYAEAFAQHSIGGAGSHPVSDAYAEHYGWAAPGKPLRDANGASLRDAMTSRKG